MSEKLVEVNRGSSCVVEFWVADHKGVYVPKSQLTGASLVLSDLDSGSVIATSNIMSSITASGYCEHVIPAEYNTIINTSKVIERHCAYITISGNNSLAITDWIYIDVLQRKG